MSQTDYFSRFFGIPDDRLGLILTVYDGFVAGSAALHRYLIEQGQEVGWEPGDLDIWFPLSSDEPDVNYSALLLLEHVAYCLDRWGYQVHDAMKQPPPERFWAREEKKIVRSFEFHGSDDKKVQVHLVQGSSVDEILTSFDLDVCAMCWTPHSHFLPSLPSAIEAAERGVALVMDHVKVPFSRSPTMSGRRFLSRVEKYKDRGFFVRRITEL